MSSPMSACVWKRIDRLIEPTTSQRRLDATDIPAPGFVQAFCASQQLSQQLAQERHFNANGQAALFGDGTTGFVWRA